MMQLLKNILAIAVKMAWGKVVSMDGSSLGQVDVSKGEELLVYLECFWAEKLTDFGNIVNVSGSGC